MRKHSFPPHWCLTKLSEVAAPVPNSIVDGPFGSNLKLSDYVEEGIPVLQGKNITNNKFQWFDVRFISDLKAKELKRSSVRVGDILLVKIGSIGYSAIIQDLHGFDFAIIPANLAKMTPNPDVVDIDYLHKWITSPDAKHYLENSASKTAQPALSLGKIKNLPVPLPPLQEQRIIADILDRAEALRAKRRAALDQLDELTQSIFIDMFGDPVKNPKEFSIVQLESLFSAKKDGTKCGPFGSALKKHEYVESGIPVWTMDNIAENKFIKNGCLYITEEKYQKLKAYSVDEGDVLISRAGTVGKMCVVNSTDCPSIISTNLIRLSLNSSKIEPIYFTSLMTYFKGKVGRLKTGDDGAYTYMNTGVLKDLQIPLPPVELQQSFAKIVEQVEKIKRSHQQSLLELNNLFDSLAHEAFTGKLFSHQFFEQKIENGVNL